MGKYTVGLPKPGPNPREIVTRWANVVRTHAAEMGNNYVRGITAVASNPATLEIMQRKLTEWFNAFFGAGVPMAFRRDITPAIERYKAARYRIVGVPLAPAPAPAPAPAIPAR